MERAVEKNEKLESFKLESPKLNWKDWNWKAQDEVGKLGLKLESTTEVGKYKLNLERSLGIEKLNWYKNGEACF